MFNIIAYDIVIFRYFCKSNYSLQAVLKDILDQNDDYGRKSILYQYMLNDNTVGELETGQTIVVDYR